jgi:hypothetical protein
LAAAGLIVFVQINYCVMLMEPWVLVSPGSQMIDAPELEMLV